MKINKRITFSIFILILIVIVIIVINGANSMRPEKALNNFVNQIEKGNIDDISLTIYYMNPHNLTYLPLSVDDLIRTREKEFVIKGVQLAENINLLKTIKNVELAPVKYKTRVDARIHYVFENKGRKIFDVTMWGFNTEKNDYEIIFINGIAVKANDIFYNIISPFLPEK